jgi:hypothetical protein
VNLLSRHALRIEVHNLTLEGWPESQAALVIASSPGRGRPASEETEDDGEVGRGPEGTSCRLSPSQSAVSPPADDLGVTTGSFFTASEAGGVQCLENAGSEALSVRRQQNSIHGDAVEIGCSNPGRGTSCVILCDPLLFVPLLVKKSIPALKPLTKAALSRRTALSRRIQFLKVIGTLLPRACSRLIATGYCCKADA